MNLGIEWILAYHEQELNEFGNWMNFSLPWTRIWMNLGIEWILAYHEQEFEWIWELNEF